MISQIMEQMIAAADGNHHDINHFMKVWGYAKTIGELEGLDEKTQRILETAAILHDIACPLCRKKYGNTNGKLQETEGMVLASEFLKKTGLPQEEADRVVYLVGHHHTLTGVDGMDYQILLEADYLVNAQEGGHSEETIRNTGKVVFKTGAGLRLLQSVYRL